MKSINNRGFAMVQLMVLVGVLSVLTLAISTVVTNMYSVHKNMAARVAMESLRMSIITYGMSADGIRMSLAAQENSAFRNCLYHPNSGCAHNAPVTLISTDSVTVKSDDGAASDTRNYKLAGTVSPDSPARFGRDGEPFCEATNSCLFSVVSSFNMVCGPSGCATPLGYTFWYTISAPNKDDLYREHLMSIKPKSGSFFVSYQCLVSIVNNQPLNCAVASRSTAGTGGGGSTEGGAPEMSGGEGGSTQTSASPPSPSGGAGVPNWP